MGRRVHRPRRRRAGGLAQDRHSRSDARQPRRHSGGPCRRHLRHALPEGFFPKVRSESRRGDPVRSLARGSRAARARGGRLQVHLGVGNGGGDRFSRDLRLDPRRDGPVLAAAPRRRGPRHEHDVSSAGVRGGARAGAVRGGAGLADGPRHGRGVRRRRDDSLEPALAIVYFVTLNALGHLAFVGSRMTTALFALQLGASPVTVGALMSLFALLPMLLSVSSGRLIDRIGPRGPLITAFAALACGAALPFLFPSLQILFLSSTLLGLGFMCVHIGMNSVIGAHGAPEQRGLNFSWLALGFSFSGSLGPLVAGYAIEGLGHGGAFLVLAFFPVLALALLLPRKRPLPRPDHSVSLPENRHLLDLFRVPGLRRTFIVSGMLAMGWDLYSFLMPLYGARLGLAAATIGSIMATFALATFVVRLAMPVLIRRVPQWRVLTASMAIAGLSYLLFPFVTSVPLLMANSFALGLGLGCAQPVIMSLLYEASPPGRQGEAVGVRTTMINASSTFIPLASGALSAAAGMTPAFWLLAACLLAGAWFARRRVR